MINYGWKSLVCALSLTLGTMLGAMLSTALELKGPQMPPALDLRLLGLLGLIGGVALAVGLAQIALRLRGGFGSRWFMLAWFTWACIGVTNTIEAAFYTSVGGSAWMVVSWVPASLLVAAVVARLFRPPTLDTETRGVARAFFGARTSQQWTVRLLAAWVAFPIVYLVFGIPVGLLVQDTYRAEAFGLRLPSPSAVMAVQLVRGMVVLLALVPIVVAWSGSARRFWITVGLGLFVLLGLYGLIQAYWLPWTMRGLHTLEILLDSLLYAWLLGRLLLPQPRPPLK